ncbi:MAG TPA: exosome complex exonuclease Rrp41 [Candidatus Nanoarchaeia archaeon]|nr:exosome complex exonuclease Rrp41 [Candidatus Nanoarchaeia archaeon]
MVYKKRIDGRKFDELRPIEAEVGIVKRADGSARFKIGKTEALAAVYGPRELVPKFMQNPQKGILRVHYNMMPFSGAGNRVKPGGNRRSKELSMVIRNSLLPVLNLNDFPNAVVDIYIEFPQTDAGTRCAAVTAAAMALADAGIAMSDLVNAVAVGKCDNTVLVDLNYEEEHLPQYVDKVDSEEVADIPVATIPSTGEITLLQLDGPTTKKQLMEALNLAKSTSKRLYDIQKDALKKKYAAGE